MKQTHVLVLYGMLWMVVGFFLLTLGLKFLTVSALMQEGAYMHRLASLFSLTPSQIAMFATVASIGGGFCKARFMLYKAAKRNIARIVQEKGNVPLKKIFPLSFLVLVAVMMSLGFLMKIFQLPLDIRGVVDVTVGSGLILGGMTYFIFAKAHSKKV